MNNAVVPEQVSSDNKSGDTLKKSYSSEQKFYLLSFFCLFLGLCLYGYMDTYVGSSEELVYLSFSLPLLLSVFGFCSYLHKVAFLLKDNLYLKGLFSVFMVAIVTLNFTIAGGIVNEALKVPTDSFVYTKAMSAILFSPIILAGSMGLMSILLMGGLFIRYIFLGGLSFGLIPTLSKGATFVFLTRAARFASSLIVFVLAFQSMEKYGYWEEIVSDFSKWYAYSMEMESHYYYCQINEGEKFLFHGPNLIVVGQEKEEGFLFEMRECKESTKGETGKEIDDFVRG